MIFRLRGSNIRLKCPTVITSEYILNFSSSKMIICTFFEVFLKLHFFKEIKSNYFDILLLLSLRLHVMLKPLLWAFFSLFLLPSTVFGWTDKSNHFLTVVLVDTCDKDWESFIEHTDKLLCLRPKISCVWAWHAICFRNKQ